MSRVTVTTIRHGLSNVQLSEIMVKYQTEKNLASRIDIDRLAKTGFSRVVVKDDSGYEIETLVTIDKD